MRKPLGVTLFITAILLIDVYVFLAVMTVCADTSYKAKLAIYIFYWMLTVLTITGLLLFLYAGRDFLGPKIRIYFFAIMIGLFLAKTLSSVFFLVDDIRRVVQWVVERFSSPGIKAGTNTDNSISRSVFLSWLGLAVGGSLLGSFIFGFRNKYNYRVKKVRLVFDNLPAGFKGLKIAHISDIHSGSFTDKNAVDKGVQLILDQHADIILFTGDLVNDRSSEMVEYMDLFSRLKAPLGVYSTLGNHDYGDYTKWPTTQAKEQNLEQLKNVHASMGWRLLMNENVVLERNGDRIALLGIENWSAKARFPKHGRMDLAHPGTEKYPFKILMSHDPSHWDAEVKTKYPDIDLVLSGHTHGMQFGIEIPGFKWSPVQYFYKQWDGLYEDGKQKLYVNPGFGFIGYPGRVGIMPEITVIELV